MRKFNIPRQTMYAIDWRNIKLSNASLTKTARATRSKYVYRWTCTNDRGTTTGAQSSALCPLCGMRTETTTHVLCCTDAEATRARQQERKILERDLNNLGTHPDLVTLIVDAAKYPTGPNSPDVTSNPMEDHLRRIIETQGNIGWTNFLCGFWATAWSEMQGQYSHSRGRGRESRWGMRAQLIVWRYVRSLWEYRNKRVHGSDHDERRSIRRERTRKEIQAILGAPPPLTACGLRLLEQKNSIMAARHSVQRAWLRSVRIDTRVECHRRKHERTKLSMERRQRILKELWTKRGTVDKRTQLDLTAAFANATTRR